MSESLRYPTQIFFSDEDAGYIALAPDLPGCSAFGESAEEALSELQDAIKAWIGAAQKAGNPVPSPSPHRAEELPSGRVLARLPKTLHAQLIERAARDNTSLNTCLIMLLSQSLRDERVSPSGDFVHLSDALQVVGLSTVEPGLSSVWNAHEIERHHMRWLDFSIGKAEPSTGLARRLVHGGSAMNVRILPANKPVLYVDDENG